MTAKTLSWMLTLVLTIGVIASGPAIVPAAGALSAEESFDDNRVGTTDEWAEIEFDAVTSQNDSTALEVTVRNAGDGPDDADYEVIIDNDTRDTGTIDLEAGDEWNETYTLNVTEASSIEWEVIVDGETESGTVEAITARDR